MVEFESSFNIEENEKIFLAKHELIFACNKKFYNIQRYFLLVDMGRIMILTFSIVAL